MRSLPVLGCEVTGITLGEAVSPAMFENVYEAFLDYEVIVATDIEPKDLPPGLTHDEVTAKIAPNNGAPVHAKASSGLVGLFVNP